MGFNFAPEVTLRVGPDPTTFAVEFSDKVPSWVEGYVKAVLTRQFSLVQDYDAKQVNQVLMSAKKQIDQVLENLVGQGLIFRVGAAEEFSSAGA